MKDKKSITITNAFQKVWNKFGQKPKKKKKKWVAKGRESYDRLMK